MRFVPLLLLVAACTGGSEVDLVVDLKTDLRAGVDFSEVETLLTETAGTSGNTTDLTSAEEGERFLEGRRVAEFLGLTRGLHRVEVRMRHADGRLVMSRTTAVELRTNLGITVLMSRRCAGVECPLEGDDPTATECLGGRCVPPECTPETPDSCGEAECDGDDACGAPACVTARCEDGVCLRAPDDDACADGERCDLEAGCAPEVTGCEPPGCDDGVACTADACVAGACVSTPTDEACDAGEGGRCDAALGCQYDVCDEATCAAGACERAVCDGDTCVRSSLCADGEECCAGACVAAGCDDGVACTTDRCGAGGCENVPDDSACDDGNPCTDDSCAAEGCSSTPNAAACDDGLFCNGSDTCAGGGCAGHAGDPCLPPTVCEETTDVCVGCTDDGDCPADETPAFGACGGFDDVCDTTGTESRTLVDWSCSTERECVRVATPESRPCARASTDGVACADDGNPCTADACAGGRCAHPGRTGAACSGDGNECTDDVCDAAGACTHPPRSGSCADDGAECTDDLCSGGVCTHPARTGSSCAAGVCDGTGECVECLDDDDCADSNRCTRDRCTRGSCSHVDVTTVETFRTTFGQDGFCGDDGTMGYQRVEATCFNNTPAGIEISRGFVSFDTRPLPDGTEVVAATLSACGGGGPGADDPLLYDTSFPVNLDCSTAYGAPVSFLRTLPRDDGPFTVSVATSSVDRDARSQYSVRWPNSDCAPGTWEGRRWVSSTGDPIDPCAGSQPWELEVTHCNAPY